MPSADLHSLFFQIHPRWRFFNDIFYLKSSHRLKSISGTIIIIVNNNIFDFIAILAENDRPVSLTSVSCKIMEHIICSHMLKHFDKHNILTSLNHGFRSGYSTETQLLVTMQDLLQANDKNIQMDIAILDFSKAFDTVPHDRLLQKLEAYGIRGNLHKWLSSFLKDRQMNEVVEGEHSDSAYVESRGATRDCTWTFDVFVSH